MPAAGLIDRSEPRKACLAGQIFEGSLTTADGETLPAADIEWLREKAEAGHTKNSLAKRVADVFPVNAQTVAHHFDGSCGCTVPAPPLRGVCA